MNKKNNNGITLDKLANMVAGGFEGVDKKFEDVDKKFEDVDKKLEDIDKKMVTKDEFRSLEKKVDKLDYQMDEVYDILKRFEENDILNLQKRVQILEKAVRALAVNQTSK
ncbi:MAG: hypothetical protein A2736_01355 [Candidatus Yanofskybacteria bacterium RIFCSPHIGHO2_01_FULL_41_27]|uniref:Uncharacterized protein n=2 Tax=Candidatus Yanofskyibacteriota TaxID=1752733 RepID=A0A1F8HP76_9BACT|nr:MAG: hypothetical protein A2736_01355 [Candidatus Yanofskybacteria bacterium RIFCSPHIGHO2_01_FULL_41_27]OGN20838.1 MAG: hypothetical protein A3B00_02070 [Candidatus Yanofskybacteria bacterium RIFCSPLOWO2_01_FULL_41_33]OGN39282.1 MAG: hypothetical protein A2606_00325 [Candidatus Yanofskybacteria bacterium RIFOXYD1_FULL_42_10]